MSGGLKLRRGWRSTKSSDHFSRGIDVTASMSVFHTERAGAAPACRIPFKRLRGRLREAPALKQDHVGANLTGVPLFIPFVV